MPNLIFFVVSGGFFVILLSMAITFLCISVKRDYYEIEDYQICIMGILFLLTLLFASLGTFIGIKRVADDYVRVLHQEGRVIQILGEGPYYKAEWISWQESNFNGRKTTKYLRYSDCNLAESKSPSIIKLQTDEVTELYDVNVAVDYNLNLFSNKHGEVNESLVKKMWESTVPRQNSVADCKNNEDRVWYLLIQPVVVAGVQSCVDKSGRLPEQGKDKEMSECVSSYLNINKKWGGYKWAVFSGVDGWSVRPAASAILGQS